MSEQEFKAAEISSLAIRNHPRTILPEPYTNVV
jgi:hypothetical protein